MGVGLELNALVAHLLDPTVDVVLLHLEVGNAVAKQTADAVGLLEHSDHVAGAIELLRGGEARGSGTDDADPLAGAGVWRLGLDPAFLPGVVDNGSLDHLDGNGRFVNA